jgi:O-succinylbenzoic acid--CoA ligase
VNERSLRAVLVDPRRLDQQGPRLTALLAAALDGTGPAIVPLDADLPAARLDALFRTFAPDEIEDAGGVTTVRSVQNGVTGDTAVIIGTSGSTGEPKGVRLSAAALLHSARASLARLGAEAGERWLCCLPVTHIAGLQVLVRSVVSGTDPVLAEKADSQTIATSGCAHISLVPTQLQRLAGDLSILNAFKSVLLGGAAAADGQVDRARTAGVPVVTTYGMSETCGGCVYNHVPLDGVQLRTAPDGRIQINGPVLFSGYRNRPDLTGAVIDEHGWFTTSDLGKIAPDGRLSVDGRADDMINTGGHKVSPHEIAAILEACPAVREAAVFGEPDSQWGQRVTAFVVPASFSNPPRLEELRAAVQKRLPAYAAPRALFIVRAMPLLPSGKPDLATLRGLGRDHAT